MNPILLTTLSGVLVALKTDLDAFIKAKQADPTTQFNWSLSFARAAQGAIIGFLTGAGVPSVIGGAL